MLTPGSRLGRYEITGSLGAGGMGEVYRARDTRLDRTVALKVVAGLAAASPEMRERFEREAHVLSSLEHPHICPLYDVGTHDGTMFLVMQLLDGETLAARLQRGPLPLAQALTIATEIGDALAAAHRAGVNHRDLKPGNIILTRSGAKLLDFGLAKAAAALDATMTQGAPLTGNGVILGTPHYMAPEQLEGQQADARSDIFAFGCVLYEMITGRRAFDGNTAAGVISAILKDQPRPIRDSLPNVPPGLDRAVRKALAKEPDRRWQSVADLIDELAYAAASPGDSRDSRTPRDTTRKIALSAAVLLGVLAVSVVTWSSWRRGDDVRPVWSDIAPGPGARFFFEGSEAGPPALSPDGSRLVYTARDERGRPSLWIRSFDNAAASPLEGTQNGYAPFWSADGRAIGFFADGRLLRMPTEGGPTQSLAVVQQARGGTWSTDDVIVYAPDTSGPLMAVRASGGAPWQVAAKVATTEGLAGTQRGPHFLPDGRNYLYLQYTGRPETTGIYVRELANTSGEGTLVCPADSNAEFVAPDHLLYVRNMILVARKFDPARLQVSGDETVLASTAINAGFWRGIFSASQNGRLVLQTGATGPGWRLSWFDREGRTIQSLDRRAAFMGPRLSPDGSRIETVIASHAGGGDVWLYDIRRRVLSQLTFTNGNADGPAWSRDGKRVFYAARMGLDRQGVTGPTTETHIYGRAADGGGREEIVVKTDSAERVSDVSPDGRMLLFQRIGNQGTGWDLWVAPLDGSAPPRSFLATPGAEAFATVAANGAWAAYQSGESGRDEIYLTRFPEATGRLQISSAGGIQPRWRGDGRELFYLAPDGALMAVSVRWSGQQPEVEAPVALFRAPIIGYPRAVYDVTPDGNRFILTHSDTIDATPPLTLIQNWTALMGKSR